MGEFFLGGQLGLFFYAFTQGKPSKQNTKFWTLSETLMTLPTSMVLMQKVWTLNEVQGFAGKKTACLSHGTV